MFIPGDDDTLQGICKYPFVSVVDSSFRLAMHTIRYDPKDNKTVLQSVS